MILKLEGSLWPCGMDQGVRADMTRAEVFKSNFWTQGYMNADNSPVLVEVPRILRYAVSVSGHHVGYILEARNPIGLYGSIIEVLQTELEVLTIAGIPAEPPDLSGISTPPEPEANAYRETWSEKRTAMINPYR